MTPSALVQSALKAALGPLGPVFDAVPVEAHAPYLTIGPDTAGDWSTKTSRGREHRVLVGVWDDAPGLTRTKALLGAAEQAVLAITASGGGWRIAHVLFVRSFVERDPGDPGGWSHGVADFRIRTEEI